MICGVYFSSGGAGPNFNGLFVGDVSWPISLWLAYCEVSIRSAVVPVVAGKWLSGDELLDLEIDCDTEVICQSGRL
jgi:hypothetical protein